MIFLEKKGQSQTFMFFHSDRLIYHSIENKGVKTSVPKFLGKLFELSTNQTFGVSLHPQTPPHWEWLSTAILLR